MQVTFMKKILGMKYPKKKGLDCYDEKKIDRLSHYYCYIEIGQDKAQAIIDDITKAYEKSTAGKLEQERKRMLRRTKKKHELY